MEREGVCHSASHAVVSQHVTRNFRQVRKYSKTKKEAKKKEEMEFKKVYP